MTEERKPGRRPGDPEITKRAILDAARSVFAEAGFDRATMRSIAAQADVDPALIHHHFGTKQDLFAAAHELPASPAELIAAASELLPEQRAEWMVRSYLSVLGGTNTPVVSLIRAAATNESAALMMREFIVSLLVDNAGKLSPFPDAPLRVTLLASHLVGVIFARVVLELPEASTIDVDELVPILVPMADRYLNAPDLTAF
jgi:AcrR family transcriptional regulator